MKYMKIANEKDRLMNRPGTEESTSNDLENQARLQQAMLRRQELLDKIRREQLLNEETKRPRSYSERRRYTPSPMPIPPSRRSLPDFARYNFYNTGADTNRSKPDVSQVKHVIEHKVKTPPPPRLPPITHPPPQIIPPAPGVIIQPPPPPQIMQQPAPAIIQSPPQHVIQQIPQPIVQNLTGQPQESKSMFNKADFGEMMMMQNAQLHQLVMQQVMLNGLGGTQTKTSHGKRSHSACSKVCRPHGPMIACSPVVPRPVASGAVHHHHYTSPPASQPAVHHYTQMPQMEMRGGYPLRGYASGYTGPGYAFSGFDEGNNYFYYH